MYHFLPTTQILFFSFPLSYPHQYQQNPDKQSISMMRASMRDTPKDESNISHFHQKMSFSVRSTTL